jgi:hypothetical protein
VSYGNGKIDFSVGVSAFYRGGVVLGDVADVAGGLQGGTGGD